ncbi:MAG: TetR/AcrR family transcriptional regulator [Chitinophagaceae bacterium]|nr:MAG: TetR/AcrR family transcriptional regulator [Chitinophagaceae bacterium]
MASKDRILRLKEETRCNILEAAFRIVKEDGWQALSMRKIAEEIEYTAPIIYEYFANKEAILSELNRKGFIQLAKEMRDAAAIGSNPEDQMEAAWTAYWNFAFAEKELYQLMFGVSMNCCVEQKAPEMKCPQVLVNELIKGMLKSEENLESETSRWYYTYWSIIHGLVSINLVNRGGPDEINRRILQDAIRGINRAILAQ